MNVPVAKNTGVWMKDNYKDQDENSCTDQEEHVKIAPPDVKERHLGKLKLVREFSYSSKCLMN